MYEYNLGIRFQTVVEQHSERTAIWLDPHEAITYAEINKLANKIARFLLTKAINPGDVVCLSGEKSLLTFASMLGCLKVGAPYCVLDPDSPVERLRKILSICRPGLLMVANDSPGTLGEVASDLGIEVCEKQSGQLRSALDSGDDANLPNTRAITGTNTAYIMFTSGSTGFPKAAVITHANVLNLVKWSIDTFGITRDDILTNVNALFFDNSVFDFYAALFTGACLTPFTAEEVRDPRRLVDKVAAAGCTLWFSVPSLLIFLQTMRATDGRNLGSIRRFVFGGEGYPKSKLKSLFETYSGSAGFFNVYGPTECTCICSSYQITGADFADLQSLPPLGHIAENFSSLILDEKGRPVAPGEIGELCLLGPNVGLGYYNDPDQTAASFVQNPNHDSFPEIMYRTGDLVRLEPADGKLYIHGRKDNQIKHMGYRIELEEIESALHHLDYVSEAAALHASFNGLSSIIAVVASHTEFADDQIRHDLKRLIPDYMIPSLFHHEAMLPKNANGKVDRRRLADKYLQSQ